MLCNILTAPISKLNIEGSTWIQPWDSLSLVVTCNGTGPFHKCIEIISGKYNVTGNETCSRDSEVILDTCKFSFNHYFLDAAEYTILIILSNDVSTEVHPLAVNIVKSKFLFSLFLIKRCTCIKNTCLKKKINNTFYYYLLS